MMYKLKKQLPNIITLSRIISLVVGFILFMNGNTILSLIFNYITYDNGTYNIYN